MVLVLAASWWQHRLYLLYHEWPSFIGILNRQPCWRTTSKGRESMSCRCLISALSGWSHA